MTNNIWKQIQNNHVWRGETWIKKTDLSDQIVWMEIKSVSNHLGEVDFYVATYKYYSTILSNPSDLYQLVVTDSLTGLFNRYYFLEHVSKQLAINEDKIQYIAFVDMDQFKQINDRFGHMFGDNILVNIARILKKVFSGHTIARYGGDEFVVYFTLETSLSDLHNLQIDFEKKISGYLTDEIKSMDVSASIGFAQYPKDGSNVQELISYADQRMYIKKKR